MRHNRIKKVLLLAVLIMICSLLYRIESKAATQLKYVTVSQFDKLEVKFQKDSYVVVKGDMITLSLDTNIPTESYYTECSMNTFGASAISMSDQPNKIVVTGNFAGESVLTVRLKVAFCNDNGEYLGTKNCVASTKIKVLNIMEKAVTIGKTVKLDYISSYDTYKTMRYEVSNKKVLTEKTSGSFTVAGEGISYIYLTDASGKKITVAMIEGIKKGTPTADVESEPKIAMVSDDSVPSVINVAVGYNVEIYVTGVSGIVSWYSEDGSVAEVFSNSFSGVPTSATVYGIKNGTTKISATVGERTLSVTVVVNTPSLNTTFFVLPRGAKQNIKLDGIDGASDISYKSYNEKVATVSSKGMIKTIKNGYCPILVTADGAQYVVNVNVAGPKAVSAVMNALSAEGSSYSQSRRMEEGYYDCSSLVWRSYSPLNMFFGKKKYAPVAADEAKFCVKKNKIVDIQYITKLNKLRPGDLLFYSGSSNGRYKNIRHVAIYIGQESEYFAGNFYPKGKIVHANGRLVSQAYVYNESNVSVIGRPF